MDGILLIDKPQGLTSHDVVARVRRLLRTRRVGHTGTLDPMATGVLPVAVGQATRLVEFIMAGEKTYHATMKLGVITDTQDAEGQVVERRAVEPHCLEQLPEVLPRFTGDIEQIPPMYSAIKRNGVALHRLARQGVDVDRPPRAVHIARIEILRTGEDEAELEVTCAKGTYIRTLVHDIGETLGPGAHLTRLCRTRSGSFNLAQCIALDDVDEGILPGESPAFLTPIEAMRDYSRLEIVSEAAGRLADGVPPSLDQVVGKEDFAQGDVVALTDDERLLAVARFDPTRQKEKRGDFELLKVFNVFS
ncbi:tRNA pseudouridine(55) synthase TruB [Geoalkalibacter subterraneus]|uniref:tRNA pseudouridine synthase B n=1 Tax=Geoalkalibacter subterraneus TaxID=483547 RepID=A0A0B5FNU3_9BACT|nr:tRNA pseudouridine(55) synthase TruB [Geoalkalibacter subterraneus]AJF06329.1 hypothetical protein GSUB_06895 [Geoalkalibacter subterraneus]